MVVTSAADGINRIYICSWMFMEMIIHTEHLPGFDYTIYPDSRNAGELRARIDNWPLGANWFGAGIGSSFINRFLQFDIMFIEAVCVAFLRDPVEPEMLILPAHKDRCGGF